MTMATMDQFLENRGFAVNRVRDSKANLYIFTIYKDGIEVSDNFAYPATSDYRVRDKAQKEFLIDLIHRHEMKKMSVNAEPHFEKSLYYDTDEFATREEAEHALTVAKRLLNDFGLVTVFSLAKLCGREGEAWMTKRGWCCLDDAQVKRTGDGWVVCLPAPKDVDVLLYCSADVESTKQICNMLRNSTYGMASNYIPAIKNVIFNNPATIVFWEDNTKTVVKCGENDEFDPEKGLAMAISKKALGNQGNYYNVFTKHLCRSEVCFCYPPSPVLPTPVITASGDTLEELLTNLKKELLAKVPPLWSGSSTDKLKDSE